MGISNDIPGIGIPWNFLEFDPQSTPKIRNTMQILYEYDFPNKAWNSNSKEFQGNSKLVFEIPWKPTPLAPIEAAPK
jgi:hypothetical protein